MSTKEKVRVHKEWFRLIQRRNCSCGKKGVQVYSWGEYRNAKWNTVEYICQSCWKDWADKLKSHTKAAECRFELVGKDCKLPDWLTLDELAVPPKTALGAFADHIKAQV